jgi:hypothetical protein
MAVAALAAVGLHQLMPADFRVSPHWMYPAFMVAFLAVLVVGDPGRIDRQRRWLQVTTGLMIGLITFVNAFSAGRLVVGILTKGNSFDTAGQLLLIGAVVFLTNVIAFALWYWHLDSGGPAARAASGSQHPTAFVFPEMSVPELVSSAWYPQFIDYLALSFNTATAFGPTDVAAIRPWAKVMMIAEASISLALATLVVARAVNIL